MSCFNFNSLSINSKTHKQHTKQQLQQNAISNETTYLLPIVTIIIIESSPNITTRDHHAPHPANNQQPTMVMAWPTTIDSSDDDFLIIPRPSIPTKAEFKTGSGGSGSGGGIIVGGGGGIRCGSGGGKLVHQLTGGSANDDEGYEESLYFQPTRTLRKDQQQQQQIYHNSGSK